MILLFTLITFTLSIAKFTNLQIPDYGEEIRMLHLKMDKIMEALKLEKINYTPKIYVSQPEPPQHQTKPQTYQGTPKPNSGQATVINNPQPQSYTQPIGTGIHGGLSSNTIADALKFHQDAATMTVPGAETYTDNTNNNNNNNDDDSASNNNHNSKNNKKIERYKPKGNHAHKSESSKGKDAGVWADSEKERKNHGSVENINVNGKHQGTDAALADEAYLNKESFGKGKYDIVDQEVTQKGRRFESSNRSTRKSNVTLATDVTKNVQEKKGFENHEGGYQGGEFDVDYNLDQQNSDFTEYGKERDYERDTKARNKIYKDGKEGYKNYGNEFTKYGDDSKDEEYRSTQFNSNPYGSNSKKKGTQYAPNEYNSPSLHDKFTGKAVPNSGKGSGYGYDRLHKNKESSQDDMYKGYGDEINGNKYYGSEFDAEEGIGYREKDKGSKYKNKGKLAKVKASGKNKAADYKGNYKQSNRYDILDDKQENKAFFFQTGQNINPDSPNRFSIETMDEVVYERTEKTGRRDVENYDGAYKKGERKRKADKNDYRKAYKNDEFYASGEDDREYEGRLIGREKNYRDNRKKNYVPKKY